MHTVQGLLHMHAHAATLRDSDPTLAANAMLTTQEIVDLRKIVNDDTGLQRLQSGETAGAIPRCTLTDESNANADGQGATMVQIVESP